MNKILKILLGILIVGIIVGFFYWFVSEINQEKQEGIDLYKEWCPKLDAKIVEPREGYNYNPKCFKIFDNGTEIRIYYLSKINGEYYLNDIS